MVHFATDGVCQYLLRQLNVWEKEGDRHIYTERQAYFQTTEIVIASTKTKLIATLSNNSPAFRDVMCHVRFLLAADEDEMLSYLLRVWIEKFCFMENTTCLELILSGEQ